MTLEEQIVEWARDCPAWQRAVLRRLAHGEVLGPDDCREIANRLAVEDDFDDAEFLVTDMPGAVADTRSVRLLAIRQIANVNALLPDQTLTAARDGMTVVYGDNASGKSGYARLAKRVVRARHHEAVLTNIFDRADSGPTAEITIEVDGKTLTSDWPDNPLPEVAKISFFDAACGRAYIGNESEISYRPSALFVLDGLIRACDGLRSELETLLSINASESRPFPELHPGTAAEVFLRTLSASTTADELDAICAVPPDADAKVRELEEEELRLRATDQSKERARLETLASKYERLGEHLARVSQQLSLTVGELLEARYNEAADMAAAAAVASSRSFDAEPLDGIGSSAWRSLWDAARAFSESECYAGQHFPVTGAGARCVLCHQELDEPATDRLSRFDAFVEDQTQQRDAAARQNLRTAISTIEAVDVLPADIELILIDLGAEDPDLVVTCRQALDTATAQRTALLAAAQGTQWSAPTVPLPEVPQAVASAAMALRSSAETIDETNFRTRLDETTARRFDLQSRLVLSQARDDVASEIERRRRRLPLDAARRTTDTTRITRKSTELTRSHVTTLLRDRFTRESDRLRLERVTLEDHGGQKGQLRHQPAFVGAVQNAALPDVLSEGEQTALGLAGFFTELHFDDSQSAIVLDDPVSSLDHVRREYVAQRLAELAQDRQVIVFTHDVAFVADLRRQADMAQVEFTERSVTKRGKTPGLCQESHPWKSKDVKSRLDQLDVELADMRRSADTWDSDTYEKEVSGWAGRLSETWERTISLELVGQVVDRTTLEVRPRLFRALARITDDDDKEFQESYARCSRWAPRHDKSPELNYVAPTIDELATELSRVREWFDRVRRYKQN